jgi:uncharacterized protein YjbJ (UPF0337 family)
MRTDPERGQNQTTGSRNVPLQLNSSGTLVALSQGAAKRGRYITVSEAWRVKGTAKEVKGQVRGDLGDLTDNHSEHIKGRVEEVKGKIQKNFGKTQRDLDE